MTRHTTDRHLDSLVTAIRKHRLTDLLERAVELARIDAAGIDQADGWSSTTPGNGNVGSGTGGVGRPVEQATIRRVDPDEHHTVDHVHAMHLRNLHALRDILAGLNTIAANATRLTNLRSTSDLAEPPMCWVAAQYKLPWDTAWEIHRTTDFRRDNGITYLQGTQDRWFAEPRGVSLFVYNFVRRYNRVPTEQEMRQHLERGAVGVHVEPQRRR